MKACDTTIRPSERHTISFNSLTSLFLSATLSLMSALSLVWAAPPAVGGQGTQQTEEGVVAPGQIGDSGYVVPIPEINMRSIIGGKPPVKAQPAAPTVKESPAVKEPPAAEDSSSPDRPPGVEEQTPQVQSPTPPPAKKSEPPAEHLDESAEFDTGARLPFDPEYRKGPGSTRVTEPPAQTAPAKKMESPLASPPVAPEETLEAPPPKKEVLKKKVAVTPPHLLEAAPVKGGHKTSSIERMAIEGSGDTTDNIPFAERRELEALPAEPAPRQEKVATVGRPEPTIPEPQVLEPSAPPPGTEPAEERPRPEETPSVEEPTVPPGRFASPLDPDALRSRDVKDYLTQASPILEELSLLMTRAPSLAIADFDPSDPNAVIFPKEIYVKIDAMKRDLQILDSKAFAIIPPAKYAPFHSVIRESIIQTYQACDAMINYFNDRSDGNLQKVHDHLIKARELVQKTRLAQG